MSNWSKSTLFAYVETLTAFGDEWLGTHLVSCLCGGYAEAEVACCLTAWSEREGIGGWCGVLSTLPRWVGC